MAYRDSSATMMRRPTGCFGLWPARGLLRFRGSLSPAARSLPRLARFRGLLASAVCFASAVCSLPGLVRLQGEAWGALVLQRGSAYAMTGLSAGSERVGAQQPPWEVGVAPGEAASFWRSSSRLVSLMEARMASRITRRSGPISSASR